ncbi:M50 family metallopeptidase [Fodinicola acaciae]|uniref:M50 family metallopeptidase n=1 Tax=Fodinicola acaciae TaxID=2681555 RepID=UPI0013D7D7D9|nr:M50 family metallopeptidase [Fodinicola acaciae]
MNDAVPAAIDAWRQPMWLFLAIAAVAVACVLWDRIWRVARNVVTIVHEGGHALVALLTGRQLSGIRLHSDTSGLTLSAGQPYGPGMVATAAAGYLAAPLVGTIVAVLVSFGQGTRVLWLGAAILLTMLVLVRNAYGALSLVVSAIVLFGLSVLTPAVLHGAICAGLSCFFLFAGPRTLVELHKQRRHQFIQSPHLRELRVQSDIDQLARLTGLSAGLWFAILATAMSVAIVLSCGALLASSAA